MNSRRPTGYLRQLAHKKPHGPSWREYESAKARYIAEHPESTPTEYEREMKRIKADCGVKA